MSDTPATSREGSVGDADDATSVGAVSPHFSTSLVDEVHVVRLSRPDVVDAQYIELLGDSIYRHFKGAENSRVVIDMSGVPYFDSAGIQAVLALSTSDRAAPFRPKLAALTETCRDALDLTNVIARLDVFDTVENAARSYNP